MANSKKPAAQAKASKARKQADRRVYESCSNVFKDIGKNDEQAANLLMRGRLMIEIEDVIRANGWTQAKAAKVIGVSQPRIGELISGRIDLFTLDTLVKYLNRLGKEVTIVVKDREVA